MSYSTVENKKKSKEKHNTIVLTLNFETNFQKNF